MKAYISDYITEFRVIIKDENGNQIYCFDNKKMTYCQALNEIDMLRIPKSNIFYRKNNKEYSQYSC